MITRTLYLLSLATITLWVVTATTLLYADASAYQATRAVVMDCQLDPYEMPDTQGGPDVWQLPRGAELYAGQSCVTLDETDVDGDLVIWTDHGLIESMSYGFEACLPCEREDDAWSCTRACYTIADTATAAGYSWDGRVYQMTSVNGSDYDVHWIRRETDPAAHDPSAIFQLTLREPSRAITLLMFYRLSAADQP